MIFIVSVRVIVKIMQMLHAITDYSNFVSIGTDRRVLTRIRLIRSFIVAIPSIPLSHDDAVIQGITSCHKNRYDHTCNNTLARTRNVIDNVRVNNAFSYEIMFILKAIKFHF